MAIDDENVVPGDLQPIKEVAKWEEHLPLLVRGVLVEAKADGSGAANFHAKALDARTRWLKEQLENLGQGGVILKGYLESQEELDAIPTDDLRVGTAYFVNFSMRVWNGTEWGDSGSLRGERGLNLLGVWPDNVSLPEVEDNEIGDAYIWQHDFWILVPNERRWEGMGIRGPEGASAYEVWEAEPANNGKTKAQYLKSLEGKDSYQLAKDNGFVGTQAEWLDSLRAKSNYELWLQAGNEGTLQEYLATLKSTEPGPPGESIKGDPGDPGADGKDGRNLAVLGTVATADDLVNLPEIKDQDAYVTRDLGHLWIFVLGKGWQDLGLFGKEGTSGKDGKDGVSLILKGAVADFASLPGDAVDQDIYSVQEENAVYAFIVDGWVKMGEFRGTDGTNGTNGTDGRDGANIKLTGSVATVDDLPGNPTDQDVYAVQDTNSIYAFIVNTWKFLGKFQGEKGDKGDSIKGDPGEPGTDGKDGKDGKYVSLKGAVDSFANLPVDAVDQDSYAVRDENAIYTFIEPVWTKLGTFKGQDGIIGQNGTNLVLTGAVDTYESLPAEPVDQDVYAVRDENSMYGYVNGAWLHLGTFKGADGTNGTNGDPGKDGKDGRSVEIIKVLDADDSTIPVADASNAGKGYIDLEGKMWVNIGNVWKDTGAAAVMGSEGPAGPALKPRGTVATVTDLPDVETAEPGDMWFTADTKMAYVKVDGQWSDPIDMVGEEGKQGPEGAPGALMPILGMYNTMLELTTAHPTGERGDAYLIVTAEGRDLVVWNINTNSWQNTGPAGLRGEKGEKGDTGIGKQGDKGEKGSTWLTLPEGQDEPSNTFNGRAGDWAVTKNMKVWYKTADKGWIFWNDLVAGDVNSPLQSEGVVARFGDKWVPVPVDEVEAPVVGGLYARQLVEGSEDKTEWVLIAFPEFPDVEVADGKQYVRVWEVGAEEPIYKEIVFPESIADLVLDDGKQYVRVFKTGSNKPEWAELALPAGVVLDPENPEAASTYLRRPSDHSWVKFNLPAATAGVQWVFSGGDWKSFDRYDLAIKNISATYTIVPANEQFVKLDNSGATAKTISLGNHTGTRAMVVVLRIAGVAGAVSYGGTNIKWDNNTIPSLSGTVNYILFTWDGEFWTGSKGANLLN